jgi:hypothetical protein
VSNGFIKSRVFTIIYIVGSDVREAKIKKLIGAEPIEHDYD